MPKIDYKSAGVNIDAGNEAVDRIKSKVQSTYTPAVLSELGGFGSFYDLSSVIKNYTHPVMVQSIDGVGTKIIVARLMRNYTTIGHDLMSACCNDIIVHGAQPLTFLDYIANDRLEPVIVEAIVSGIADACRKIGVSLVGGETAEMPDTYLPGENDLVGIVTGVVERDKIINGSAIRSGDVLIGIESSGLHTNGYSLARKLFFDMGKYTVNTSLPELDRTVGETLLEPHINYTNPVLNLLDTGLPVNGIAHITGGGFIDNLPRILPAGCSVEIEKGAWPILPVFSIMQELGELDNAEMYHTFNMGIGLTMIVNPGYSQEVVKYFTQTGLKAYTVGRVVSGNKPVQII
ncbi:MAG: phosphoribosylformylglycinamidine cyclo-ligase [Candidatus Marinimicrobia bacterium]|nr:phosphoribosylformylglycinamidine cyclo-ligase [Candidatus Neomarinimicrobiota bacterium]